MSLRIKAIIVMVVVVLIGLVILQNNSVVAVRFLFWRAELNAIFLYLVLFLSGVVVGVLADLALRRNRKP